MSGQGASGYFDCLSAGVWRLASNASAAAGAGLLGSELDRIESFKVATIPQVSSSKDGTSYWQRTFG